MRTLAVVLAVAFAVAPGAGAGEAPKRAERQTDLEEVVKLALERNLRLAAERINPERADTVIVEETAIFDPTAYGELSRSKIKDQPTSGFAASRRQQGAGMLGVAKLFPLGTAVDAHFGATKNWSNFAFPGVVVIDPAYEEEWGLTLKQPLLRGFGVRVNTAGIATARIERRVAQAELRDVALQTVLDAKRTYWELVFAIGNRGLLQSSLERAQSLRNVVIQAKIDARVLGPRDPHVLQADAEIAVRHEAIVIAEDMIRNAEESLKVITDLAADPAVWNVALVPTTQPPADLPPLDAERAVQTALKRRPDYKQAELAIEAQDIALFVRRNQVLPKVDLMAGGGHTGLGGNWNAADHSLGTLDYYNWMLGISIEYPLGNRAAHARLRRTRLERQRATISLSALERQIQLEVRNAVRKVTTNAESRRAAEVSVRAEQERVRTEEIRFKEAGVGTSQDVLDAQSDLARAEIRSLRALLNLSEALDALERIQGTLLDAANVTFEEE